MSEKKDSSTLVLYVIGVLLLGVGAAWLFLSRAADAPQSSPLVQVGGFDAGRADNTQADAIDVEGSLQMADLAMQAGQIDTPPDASALHFFSRALRAEPDNERAARGLDAVVASLTQRAQAEFRAADYAALAQSMGAIARLQPSNAAYLALQEQLTSTAQADLSLVDAATIRGQFGAAQALLDGLATMPGVDPELLESRNAGLALALAEAQRVEDLQAPLAAEQAATTAAAAVAATDADTNADAADGDGAETDANDAGEAQSEIVAILTQARASVTAGRLVQPADSSALYFFNRARELEPDNALAVSGLRDVVNGLCDRALAAAAEGNWTQANSRLDEAQGVGVLSTKVADTRAQILGQRVARESERIIPIGELATRKVVRPRYPVRALRNDVTGWVMLNLTVKADGSVDDIVVIETSDRYGDLFARSALLAVAKWQFEPREFLGQVIDQRVRARVSFDTDGS